MTPPDFVFDADHLALDLLNTVRNVDGSRRDLLEAPGSAAAWLTRAGVADPSLMETLSASPPLARRFLEEAVRLREGIRGLVEAFSRGTVLPESGLFALNRVLEARSSGLRVEGVGPGAELQTRVTQDLPLGPLAPVAEACARLLAEGDRARLRRCDGEACGLWFHDVSRNGRRRWCSMARCGNRAKVAAHYRRSRSG